MMLEIIDSDGLVKWARSRGAWKTLPYSVWRRADTPPDTAVNRKAEDMVKFSMESFFLNQSFPSANLSAADL